jgi:hypothetical protein
MPSKEAMEDVTELLRRADSEEEVFRLYDSMIDRGDHYMGYVLETNKKLIIHIKQLQIELIAMERRCEKRACSQEPFEALLERCYAHGR